MGLEIILQIKSSNVHFIVYLQESSRILVVHENQHMYNPLSWSIETFFNLSAKRVDYAIRRDYSFPRHGRLGRYGVLELLRHQIVLPVNNGRAVVLHALEEAQVAQEEAYNRGKYLFNTWQNGSVGNNTGEQ